MAARIVRVLYHCPCPDGAFSALAAHLHFRKLPNLDIAYVPHTTFKALDYASTKLFTKETEVYMLDYCGPSGFITDVAPLVKQLTLIDHHKTAQEIVDACSEKGTLPGNVTVELNMLHSGATLSYFHFNKLSPLAENETQKAKLEKMFSYIEDHDLFKHALVGSKEFARGMAGKKIEYDHSRNSALFEQLLALVTEFDDLIAEGTAKIAEETTIINTELATSFTVNLGGGQYGQCLGIVTTHPGLRSELGNVLAAKSKEAGLRAIGCLAYIEEELHDETKFKVSLRSIGDEDTTVISKAFAGGGHKNASSFLLPVETFRTWHASA